MINIYVVTFPEGSSKGHAVGTGSHGRTRWAMTRNRKVALKAVEGDSTLVRVMKFSAGSLRDYSGGFDYPTACLLSEPLSL